MLVVDHIYKSFGELEVLRGVSMEVDEGQVMVVVGPSGSGKSTLLRCINALEPIQGGEVYLEGTPVHHRKTKRHKMREQLGFVFQQFNLFSNKTALQNITLALSQVKKMSEGEAKGKAMELLERVGLPEKAPSYPHELSGGQQQRVAIARSIAMNPKLIMFDEPTSALDPEMIKEVLDVMIELARSGMTMIVVTHEMGFAREVADEILLIDEGKIIETGAPEHFFTSPEHPRTVQFLSKILIHA